jgi:hypothetical protein
MNQPPFKPTSLQEPGCQPFVTLSYDEAHHLIKAEWHNHLTSKEVIMAGAAYLKILEDVPCTRLLSDKSHISGDWSEANDWLEYEWIPEAVDAGLRCFAYVLSEDIYNRMAGLDLYKRLQGNLKVKLFSSVTDAENWLAACK